MMCGRGCIWECDWNWLIQKMISNSQYANDVYGILHIPWSAHWHASFYGVKSHSYANSYSIGNMLIRIRIHFFDRFAIDISFTLKIMCDPMFVCILHKCFRREMMMMRSTISSSQIMSLQFFRNIEILILQLSPMVWVALFHKSDGFWTFSKVEKPPVRYNLLITGITRVVRSWMSRFEPILKIYGNSKRWSANRSKALKKQTKQFCHFHVRGNSAPFGVVWPALPRAARSPWGQKRPPMRIEDIFRKNSRLSKEI